MMRRPTFTQDPCRLRPPRPGLAQVTCRACSKSSRPRLPRSARPAQRAGSSVSRTVLVGNAQPSRAVDDRAGPPRYRTGLQQAIGAVARQEVPAPESPVKLAGLLSGPGKLLTISSISVGIARKGRQSYRAKVAFSPSNNVRPFDSEPRPDPQDPEDPQDLQDPLDPEDPHIHLAVALDGAGWHPAAWREPAARPAELFTARSWADLVREAERGLLDLRHVRGRAGAAVLARRRPGCPGRSRAGAPGRGPDRRPGGPADPAHRPGPYCRRHAHRAVPPLQGDRRRSTTSARAGPESACRCRRGPTRQRTSAAATFPRSADAAAPEIAARPGLFDEAADYVEVVRRLWDSWEDDAEIRDVATGRFVDSDKLHYIDFDGPRSASGALDHAAAAAGPAARQPPWGTSGPATGWSPARPTWLRHPARRRQAATSSPRSAAAAATRPAGPASLHVFGDLVVFLATPPRPRGAARSAWTTRRAAVPQRRRGLRRHAAELADLLQDWQRRRPVRISAPAGRDSRRPDGDHPGAGARTAAPGRCSARGYGADTLRGRSGWPARPTVTPHRRPARTGGHGH